MSRIFLPSWLYTSLWRCPTMTAIVRLEMTDPAVMSPKEFPTKMILTELLPFDCPFLAFVKGVKSGHLKTRYEFSPIIHKGIIGLLAQSKDGKIVYCCCHDGIGQCWTHWFICCRQWPQEKDAVDASSFHRGFLGLWDWSAEPAILAVAMVRGGVPRFCGVLYYTCDCVQYIFIALQLQ